MNYNFRLNSRASQMSNLNAWIVNLHAVTLGRSSDENKKKYNSKYTKN